jgi:hypothetical protein
MEATCDVESQRRELDGDVALHAVGDGAQQEDVGLGGAPGRLAVGDVLAQAIEGGLDAAGLQPQAGSDGRFGRLARHETAGQEGESLQGLPRRRPLGAS